ncbi:tetratricopeptide repeat protein [Bacillus altitudinis]|uniref:tetratricopeptide repeat protein n=1 Tax=Bacillus altitudinis TaxID=293387 RepID=UPI0011A01AC3|nr:tetratricopeptide repeat protein [Bacillus altitudinis]
MSKYTSQNNHTQVVQLFQDGHYFFHKGLKAYRERNLSRASKLIQRAIVLEPENVEMLSQLAIIYTEMGHYQQSNELLDFILEHLDENMSECHYFKANNYANLGLFQEAYRCATAYAALEEDGEFADENDDLLDLLDMSDDVDEDFPYDQDDLIVKQDQANHLLESGRLDEAIEMLEQMIVEYPEFWSAYNNLALAYFYSGQIDQAKEMLNRVLHENPGNLHALCNQLVFYHYEKEEEKVNLLAKQLTHVYPILSEQRYKLGATFALVGEFEWAFKWLYSLYKTGFQGDSTFLYWLASAAYYTGHKTLAQTVWDKMVEEDIDADEIKPWQDKPEESEPMVSIEERLTAYYVSKQKGERDVLQSVLDSRAAKTAFEQQFIELLLFEDQMEERSFSEDAVFAKQAASALEEAVQPDSHMPYFWLFHIIQQARASGVEKKNAIAWAAASYYLWMNEQEESAVSKKEIAASFQVSVQTLSKYEDIICAFMV